jgi:hypothetical protein
MVINANTKITTTVLMVPSVAAEYAESVKQAGEKRKFHFGVSAPFVAHR